MKNFKTTGVFMLLSLATLTLTACDKGDKKVVTPATTTATSAPASTPAATNAAAPNIATNTPEYATARAIAIPMASLLISVIANNNTPASSTAAPTPLNISPQAKACVLNSDYATSINQFQAFLETQLTPAELTESNTFYASAVGQKLMTVSKQKLQQKMGDTVANPLKFSPDEETQLQKFAETPVGIKIQTLFAANNQATIQKQVLEPMAQAEFKRCGIMLNLADPLATAAQAKS